jgi:GTPase SAR1 family protein
MKLLYPFQDYSTIPAVDAILVVFSTIDRTTFHHAQEALSALRRDTKHDVIVLVANKIDLVRNRQVAEQGNN